MKNFSQVEAPGACGSRGAAAAMRSRSCTMKTERKGSDIALELYLARLSFLKQFRERWLVSISSHLLFSFYKPILIGLYFSGGNFSY